jgi:hypothetical protein
MTARTNVQSMSGATLALSASRPATFDAAGYLDTDVVISWTTIGEVENFGEHGVQAQVLTFTNVGDAIVQKLKGSKDYGTMNLVLGNVESNTGQVLLATASESQNRYSARIIYPLGDGEVSPSTHYLDVLVVSRNFQDGDVNAIRKIAVGLALCKKPVEVAAT